MARFQPTPDLTIGEREWAIFQHRVAVAVLVELDQRGKGIEWLADELDVNADWLTRKLYGRVPADLGEMFEWSEGVGITISVKC